MNLLIVEDEIRLSNSLANDIPWEELGIEIVGIAADGYEALELIARKKPDIVLLDIELPEMDGISLSREVLRGRPEMKIVILTGHDDFIYAQAAVDIGIFKYLLKPAEDYVIRDTVLEAADGIRAELQERHNRLSLQRKWNEHLPRLQEDFCRNWIGGKFADWELQKYARELGLPIAGDAPHAVAVAEMDPLPANEVRFGERDMPLLQFSLYTIARELLAETTCRVFADAGGATVMLFAGEAGESASELTQRANVYALKLLEQAKECLKLTASAGIGAACGSGQVPQSYKQAVKALQERAVFGPNIAVPFNERKHAASATPSDPSFEKQLQAALETGERERALRLVDTYAAGRLAPLDSIGDVQEHLLYLHSLLVRIVHAQGWSAREVAGEDNMLLRASDWPQTKEHIVRWAHRMCERIADYAEKERNSSTHALIKRVLALIEAALDQDLSLHTVADQLYVNSSYLSRLFKRDMHKSFSAFVVERKMRAAKELLQQGVKVYDVSRQVGYRDVSYFSKLFRKYWGVTPGELKK